MLEDKRKQAEDAAIENISRVYTNFSEEFASKIGNLDDEPKRDRIFLLEEMLRNTQREMNESLLKYTQELIESIDEKELIERKKASTQPKE